MTQNGVSSTILLSSDVDSHGIDVGMFQSKYQQIADVDVDTDRSTNNEQIDAEERAFYGS